MKTLWSVFDIADKRATINDLESQSAQPDFWNDSDNAQSIMQKLSKLRNAVEIWEKTLRQVNDMLELVELGDNSLAEEIEKEVTILAERVEALSFRAMLSGTHDNEDAILAIHAGAGGTDAQDWAGMLARMYLRWAESP